jgi:hypothetical protein
MRKYVATPGAEVIGSAMRNWFVSINRDEYLPVVQQVLEKYGLTELEDEKWYPHQLSLDVFRLIDERKTNSSSNLVALGLAYVETAIFPPQINNAVIGLMALGQTYHLNIRNVPKDEGYEVLQVGERQIQIKDFNPFPHDTVYGFIWGIAKRFRESTKDFPIVERTYFNPADPDSDGAVYNVKIA